MLGNLIKNFVEKKKKEWRKFQEIPAKVFRNEAMTFEQKKSSRIS